MNKQQLKEQYMDPLCGCMTFVYPEGTTTKAFCDKHQRESQIALVERRIRELREQYKAQTEAYQRERAAYLERLKELKNE